MPLRPPPDRAVDPFTVAILQRLDGILTANSTPHFLMGATARELLLWNVFGVAVERATEDVDFAVAAEDWRAFGVIKEGLIGSGDFRPDDARVHRLYYSPTARSPGYRVDIVPFGGLEAPSGQIAWPPDNDVRMNVAGFRESLAAATHVQIADELIVPVASLPSLAVLKVFAWSDRKDTTKDALDLALLLRTYAVAGNEDRLFGPAIGFMEAANYDLTQAGAQLLGADARDQMLPDTARALVAIVTDPRRREKLTLQMAPALRMASDPVQFAESLVAQFSVGLAGP